MRKLIMIALAFFALTLTNSCDTEDTEDTGKGGDAGTSTGTDTSKGGDTSKDADVKSDYFTLLVPSAADNESRRVIYAIIPDTPWVGFARDKSVSVVSAVDGDGCLKVHTVLFTESEGYCKTAPWFYVCNR